MTDDEIDAITDAQWGKGCQPNQYQAHRAFARAVLAAAVPQQEPAHDETLLQKHGYVLANEFDRPTRTCKCAQCKAFYTELDALAATPPASPQPELLQKALRTLQSFPGFVERESPAHRDRFNEMLVSTITDLRAALAVPVGEQNAHPVHSTSDSVACMRGDGALALSGVALLAAINWLMGCDGDFEQPADIRGAYWWRTVFARKAGLVYDGNQYQFAALPAAPVAPTDKGEAFRQWQAHALFAHAGPMSHFDAGWNARGGAPVAQGDAADAAPPSDAAMSASEQEYLMGNPDALLMLMDYHDQQQDQADSMGAECWGDELRAEELRLLGAAIVATDPDCFSDDARRRFGPLSEYAAKRLERARAAMKGTQP